MIGYGPQVNVLEKVATLAKEQLNVRCEVIDLKTLLPWDKETVINVSIHLTDIQCGSRRGNNNGALLCRITGYINKPYLYLYLKGRKHGEGSLNLGKT